MKSSCGTDYFFIVIWYYLIAWSWRVAMVHYLLMVHIFLKLNILSSIVSQILKSHITLNILSWIPHCSKNSSFLPKRILKKPNHFYLWQRYYLDLILLSSKMEQIFHTSFLQFFEKWGESWTRPLFKPWMKKLKSGQPNLQ